MSLLLALFTVGLTAKMISEVGRDVTKIPARSQIAEDSRNGTFDVVKNFEQILYICDVKRKKINSNVPVLPYEGYRKCLKYIREHHLTCKADEQRFITHYRKVLSEELAERQKEFDQHYAEVESEVRMLINTEEDYQIVRFQHIDALVTYADVEMKVNEICNKTFLGDFVVGKVKIKQNTSGNAFTEIWALKIPVGMRFKLRTCYEACALKCNYLY